MRDDLKLTGRDEIEALLPFYLNGTLEGADLERVEAWLEADADAMSALAAAEAEHDATVHLNEAVRLPDDALGKFTESLDKEGPRSRASAGGGVIAAIWERLAGAPPSLAWGTAAAALALVFVQAVTSVGERSAEFGEAGIERAVDSQSFLLLTFAPDADMRQVTELLARQGLSIIGGPRPGAIYEVAVAAETRAEFDAAAARLAEATFVTNVLTGRAPQARN